MGCLQARRGHIGPRDEYTSLACLTGGARTLRVHRATLTDGAREFDGDDGMACAVVVGRPRDASLSLWTHRLVALPIEAKLRDIKGGLALPPGLRLPGPIGSQRTDDGDQIGRASCRERV